MKVLKIEEELETTNSDKSGKELKTVDSVEHSDSDKPYHLKVKQIEEQRKPQVELEGGC